MPIPIVTVVTAQVTGAFLRRVCYGMNRTGGERSPANELLAAVNSVDSELSCSVLVAQHMSASFCFCSACGTVGNAQALSTFPQACRRADLGGVFRVIGLLSAPFSS